MSDPPRVGPIGAVVACVALVAQTFVVAVAAEASVAAPVPHQGRDYCTNPRTPPVTKPGPFTRCAGSAAAGAARGDFDGDGFGDLAIGVPFDDVTGVDSAGSVSIIYGSSSGLNALGDQVLTMATFGQDPATDDLFGSALAAGDFDGNGFSDLAIGVPGRDGGGADRGLVTVISGTAAGLTATPRRLTFLGNPGSRAGSALVWGDFDGDRFADLAVGLPGRTRPSRAGSTCFDGVTAAGEVQIVFGSSVSLNRLRDRFLQHEECGAAPRPGELADARFFDRFGSTLSTGFFSRRIGREDLVLVADLVVGVPGNSAPGRPAAGSVYVIPGSAGGPRMAEAQVLNQSVPGVGGGAEADDRFGHTAASGDLDGDRRDDLVVGVPGEDLVDNTRRDGGAVQVFLGADASFVDAAGDQFISQSDLAGQAVQADDLFGWSVAVGRFEGPSDALEDLAIGVPGEAIADAAGSGMVSVLYGSSTGPRLSSLQTFHQNSPGVPDSAETRDRFGFSLSAWDFGNGTQADLAIGAPLEDLVGARQVPITDTGAVTVIYGNLSGLNATARPAQLWHRNVTGIVDTAQPGDQFGRVLY